MMNQIRIGAIDFKVAEVDSLWTVADGENIKVNGVLYSHLALIEIDEGLPDVIKQVCLWHEAIHEILNQAGIIEHDENIVEALGYGIVALLRDNDGL